MSKEVFFLEQAGVDWARFARNSCAEMEMIESLKDQLRSGPIFSKQVFQTDLDLEICFKAAA